jgi:hypothetical protein
MECVLSIAFYIAMESITASIRGRGVSETANTSQPEEVFVPFHLPSLKPQPTAEAQPPVAIPTSSYEARPIGV